MNSKYNEFKNAMENLESEMDKKECEMLLELAQNFYSYYKYRTDLSEVEKRMANIYSIVPSEKENDGYQLKLKNKQLDIIDRLVLNFYREIINNEGFFNTNETDMNERVGIKKKDRELSKTTKFYDFICKGKNEINYFIKRYRLEENNFDKHNLAEIMEAACKAGERVYKGKTRIDFGLDNIQETINIYNKSIEFKLLPEKDCFDALFSDEYINRLLCVMKNSKGLLFLYTTPVRTQLCESSQGGTKRDNKSLFWCYKNEYRKTLSDLKESISKIYAFSTIFKKYSQLNEYLNEALTYVKNLEEFADDLDEEEERAAKIKADQKDPK